MPVVSCGFIAGATHGGVVYINETATRLASEPAVGIADTEEKNYAWGDVDRDGDVDLVTARKQPFATAGGRRNVLFLTRDGVLTDATAEWITGFLDPTNDRDVALVDVNGDAWLDIVTAATCHGCAPAGITDDSRLYVNLGAPEGTWLGYGPPAVLFGDGRNMGAVAGGDVTGDGWADLYFVSYNDAFEDQLLVNGGPAAPGTFTVENDRLTEAMRSSFLGTAAVIADMDGDGDGDIVKCDTGFGAIEIFRNSGSGVFDLLDPTYSGAAHHVQAGSLNGDGLPDLVVTDDGVDRYVLNDGNLIDGVPDASLVFPNATSGFGGESAIADLDNDGLNDVLISSINVEVPGCSGVSDILRNLVSAFTPEAGNIPATLLTGVHDFAVFDVNGDGLLDIVIGRCNGTTVLIATCPWDLDGDGEVGVVDFLALLAAWGPSAGNPADLDGDGAVNVMDLLVLLANWGPCP